MISLSSSAKKKITTWLMVIFFAVSSFLVFNTVRAIPVEEVASVPKALQYVVERLGSIFFQNIGRKIINDFAYDAATYLGSGGKGQNALFIKEKWGNFWKNVGDKALGDFIETFANTVVSDVASMNQKKDRKAQCQNAYTACTKQATSGTGLAACQAQLKNCNSMTSEAPQRAKCDAEVKACKAPCAVGRRGPNSPQVYDTCIRNCEITYNYCWSNIEVNRKKPMFNSQDSPLAKVNICNPRLDILLAINFGLTQYGPTAYNPNCSFSEMANNWQNEIDRQKAIYTNKNYLNDLVMGFRPVGNDLGVALTLNSNIVDYEKEVVIASKDETIGTDGWLDIRNFAGDLVGTPDEAKSRKKLTEEKLFQNLDKVTGDILVDAANIFINQLLITGWQTLTGSLVDDTKSSSPVSYWSAVAPGRQAIENKISKIKEPSYSAGKTLNILADLASCEKPENPGPTNCVIDTNFSNAITSKMTVGRALDTGLLQKDWPFGFDKNGQEKIQYNQGYSYRSMVILRKYRILPVGWEMAAQKIQQAYLTKSPLDVDFVSASGKLKEGVSLEDMVSCYEEGDKYNSYSASWCKGLVDPNWVLKLPEYYCGRQGYGPELVQDFEIQNNSQKSCGVMDSKLGTVSRAQVDGGFKNCSTDNDCCTRLENLAIKDALKNKKTEVPTCSASCSYEEAKLTFARNDKYCADEQSCIKEDPRSGKCLAYGYCTKERRQWVFDQKGQDQICEPYMNTCKSYKGAVGNVSYLENTLDFNNCSADTSGCRAYSPFGAYDEVSSTMTWNNINQIYFNSRVKKCDKRDEGCHQFIRIPVDSGTNLLADGDFEANDIKRWQDAPNNFGSVYNSTSAGVSYDANFVASGQSSLHVIGAGAGIFYGPTNRSLLPKNFEFEIDQAYTLSANIYVESGSVEIGIGNAGQSNYTKIEATNTGWNQYTLTVDNDFTLQANSFRIVGVGNSSFYVDDVKFEIGGPTSFSPYYAANQAYQKLLPEYLADLCYVNPPSDYSLKEGAPAICTNYVRRCNKDETGCNLFTDNITKDQTAAKVKPKDMCPEECVGFDKFIQQENYFYSARLAHFIPRTARSCSADKEGCSMFVNLDKVPEGGEENEYFSEFRRCIKPDDSCGDFITWEGSDVSGYQITSFKLQINDDNKTQDQPKTVVDNNQLDDHDTNENGDDLCSEAIFKLASDHPLNNADCRQFFGKDGSVSYHLYSKTVICVDDCYYYRQVEQNIDPLITSQAQCAAAIDNGSEPKKGKWLDDKSQCVICRNDGTWDDTHNACVFRGWPNESTTCAQSEVGCSKYVGDTGHNVKVIFNDTFENNNNAGWFEGGSNNVLGGAQVTTDSLSVGGHSIQPPVGGTLSKKISGNIKPGKKYTLTFMARRRDQAAKIDGITLFYSQPDNTSFYSTFTEGGKGLELTNKWKSYKFIIDNIKANGALTNIDFTGLTNTTELRFDNIKLMEADDIYYLIKDSWKTPETCNQDHRGRAFPLYMLGCRAYTDMNGSAYNLRSFDQLCQASAAGCELMIDTFNSTSYDALTIKGVTVPADEMTYVVYDKNKTCNASQKGCQFFGRSNRVGAYTDIHLLNDPDIYTEILCSKDSLYCETWTDQSGTSVYFKDPGEKVCEYLSPEGGTEGWYVKRQQFCYSDISCTPKDPNDPASLDSCANINMECVPDEQGINFCTSKMPCTGQSDCSANQACKFTGASTPCPTTYHKTVGLGVAVSKLQPVGMADSPAGNAGICEAKMAGCTEYIDPESKFNFNQWLDMRLDAQSGAYKVSLKPDVLYILKAGDDATASYTINGCDGDYSFYPLDHKTNEFGTKTSFITVKSETVNSITKPFSQEFYLHRNNDNNLDSEEIKCSLSSTVANGEGSLREAVVAYRLKDSINKDRPTTMRFDEGKILFNERMQNGKDKKPLTYSSNITDENSAPQSVPTNPPGNNSNALLKVDPDRVCDQWLGCKTYIFNPLNINERICIERNLCDRLNKANECSHFVSFQPAKSQGSNAPVNQLYGLTQDANGTTIAGTQDVSLTRATMSNLSGYSLTGYLGGNWLTDYYHLAGMQEIGGAKIKIDGSFEGKSLTGFKTRAGASVVAISDPKVVEKELGLGAYTNVPDGQAIGKMNSGQAYLDISNPGTSELVVSMKVFLRTGANASIRIGSLDKSCPLNKPSCSSSQMNEFDTAVGQTGLIAQTNVIGRWTPLIGKFEISDNYNIDRDIRVWLISDGIAYFDDLKIEPALVYRDDNTKTTDKQQYMQSICRLYPMRDSMSCDYYDSSGLRRKGWVGYCLQYDPRNAKQCLMWYPIDKVASDEFEEGASLSIDKDLYYCIDSWDQCNMSAPVVPEFYCKTFIKVDKNKYWHDRINEGSPYELKPGIFNSVNKTGKLSVDFGIDNPPVKPGGIVTTSLETGIAWSQGSGFYGAYSSREEIGMLKNAVATGMDDSNGVKRLMPIVPFFGESRAGQKGTRDEKYVCKGTIDNLMKDRPIPMSSGTHDSNARQSMPGGKRYDLCTVGSVMQTDNNDMSAGSTPEFTKYCAESNYNWASRSSWPCTNADRSDDCGENPNEYCTNTGNPRCMVTNNFMTKCRSSFPSCACNALYETTDQTQAISISKSNGNWDFACYDWADDSNDSICLFDCYNHTKSYNIGASTANAYYGVQRLFTQLDGLYTWNDVDSYVRSSAPALQRMIPCVDTSGNITNIRPIFNPLGTKVEDYCFIRPVVDNIKVSPSVVVDQGYVTMTFTSKIDPEQLPLRRIVINLGVKNKSNQDIKKSFNLNIFDHPDPNNPHKFLLSYDTNEILWGTNETERKVTPCVEVYDNWYNAQSVKAGNGGKEMYSSLKCLPIAQPLIITKTTK